MEMWEILGLKEQSRVIIGDQGIIGEENRGTVQGSVADKRFVEKKRIVGMNGKLWDSTWTCGTYQSLWNNTGNLGRDGIV